MQLDRTEIAIRARSALELFDLSLQVLKRHALPIAVSSAILGWPLLLLDSWATAWMLGEDALLAAELLDEPLGTMRWRHAAHIVALFVMQFPLITLPTSIYLGHQIFFEPISLRNLLARLWSIAGRCLLVLGIVRLALIGLLVEPLIDRNAEFSLTEFWFIFMIPAVGLLVRATRPFAPEILGLELCPLKSKRPDEIAYRVRSSGLHRYLASEHLYRFMATTLFATLLFGSVIAAQMFAIGASTGTWVWNYWFDYFGLPLSLWCVGLLIAVFRFLAYLDSRIRLEGWEIELRLKAEAIRLDPPAPIATAPEHGGGIGNLRGGHPSPGNSNSGLTELVTTSTEQAS